MFTTTLQDSLNKAWQNCWPVSDLRPTALLDLISYLFFIKKSDDLVLIHQKIKAKGTTNFVYTKETENFSWSNLQSLNTRDIHQLFTKDNGIIDLMNNYAQCDALFSDYFKAPLLIDPTPKLLCNAIDIINLIETNDKDTREKIVEYLFIKSSVSNENSKLFFPQHLLSLMTSIAEPSADDTILDPAAANGSLLISAFKFTNDNSLSGTKEIKISGVESDIVHLRIAAMNMMLHGINDPDIHITASDKVTEEKASLIISALPSQNEDGVVSEMTFTDFAGKETFLLNDITERLSDRGRAIVLVRQELLQFEDPAVIKVRKKLVDQFNLEGVITLATKNSSAYSGTAILVFNRLRTNSENVWFYKWKNSPKKLRDISQSSESSNYDIAEAERILHLWKTRKDLAATTPANSFFIPADFLRNNHYKLSFNDYKLARQQQSLEPETVNSNAENPEIAIAATKENLHEFFEPGAPLPQQKRKRKMAPVLWTLVILLFAAAFYWVYSKNNYRNFIRQFTHSTSNASLGNHLKDSVAQGDSNQPISSPDSVLKNNPTKETNTKQAKTKPKKYTVLNKTWFHYEPDSTKIKPLYLTPRNDVVLTSGDEENGFIYVVYINSKGESTHGWLDKRDLQVAE